MEIKDLVDRTDKKTQEIQLRLQQCDGNIQRFNNLKSELLQELLKLEGEKRLLTELQAAKEAKPA